MRNIPGRTRLGLPATLAACAWASAAPAQTEGKWQPSCVSFNGDPGAPNLPGLWLGSVTGVPGAEFAPDRGSADGRPATYYAPYPLPYTSEYQTMRDDRVAAARQGHALADITAQRPAGRNGQRGEARERQDAGRAEEAAAMTRPARPTAACLLALAADAKMGLGVVRELHR